MLVSVLVQSCPASSSSASPDAATGNRRESLWRLEDLGLSQEQAGPSRGPPEARA